MTNELSKAASAMGKKGGSVRSERKTAACRENGKRGGRPIKKMNTENDFNNGYKSARQTVCDYGYDFTFKFLSDKIEYSKSNGWFSSQFVEAYWDGYAKGLQSFNEDVCNNA